jgi:hypothetical protein
MPNNPQNAKTFFIFSLLSFYETEPFPIASETFFCFENHLLSSSFREGEGIKHAAVQAVDSYPKLGTLHIHYAVVVNTL